MLQGLRGLLQKVQANTGQSELKLIKDLITYIEEVCSIEHGQDSEKEVDTKTCEGDKVPRYLIIAE